MGDHASQFPSDRQPRGMGEFETLLLHRLFHSAAATAFEQESGDQPGLHQEHGGGDGRFGRMFLQERQGFEPHDGVARNRVGVDVPPPDLPPVDVHDREHDLRQAQRGGRDAVE